MEEQDVEATRTKRTSMLYRLIMNVGVVVLSSFNTQLLLADMLTEVHYNVYFLYNATSLKSHSDNILGYESPWSQSRAGWEAGLPLFMHLDICCCLNSMGDSWSHKGKL